MTKYRHFTLEPLADGVWAALADVNAGIVDLGDRTIIFDTFAELGSARELREAAETLTGRPATYVINSHYHADHVHGNIVFADHAILVASRGTRDAMVAEGVGAMGRMKDQVMAGFADVRQQLAAATEEQERVRIQAVVQEYEEFLADYPTPGDLRFPALTFEQRLTFHGSRRTAELITFGGAHSPSDAVLWLPAEQILFVGDLVIPGGDLIMSLGRPENWLPMLDELEALGARTLVPGHLKVVPAAEGYPWARQYLTQMFRWADAAVAEGETPDAADGHPVPDGSLEYWFRQNLRFLIAQRRG